MARKPIKQTPTTGRPVRKPAKKKVTKVRTPAKRTISRDNFSAAVLRHVAHEVGHRCSNPDCPAPTAGPSREKGISSVGVGAHITAAAPGGPRFDASLTPEQRKSAHNAIWLCSTCGSLIDRDAVTYTVGQLQKWKVGAIERARRALASGGRSTTDGLIAQQLELQKEQLREQRLEKFRDIYGRFLQEAKAYARTIAEYWEWMLRTGYEATRPVREKLQQPVREAKAAMDRALQPILLADSDEVRRELRWEILRARGLEPVIDTIDNQRAYSQVIHYHQLRLLDGINRLQENVREALGQPPRAQPESATAFDAKMFAEEKGKADAVQADINEQYKTMMRGAMAEGFRFRK